MRGGPSTAKEGTKPRSMQLVTTQGGHKMTTWRTVTSGRKKSCVRDTSKQVMRRKSSVEEIDTKLKEDRSDGQAGFDEEGTLWKESWSSVAGDAAKDVYNHVFSS